MLRRYPSLFLLAFVVAGILFADGFRTPVTLLLIAAALCCLLGLVFISRQKYRRGALLLCVSLSAISAAHFGWNTYDLPASHISHLADQKRPFQVFAEVVDWPDLKPAHTEILVAVDSLGGAIQRRVQGRLLLKITDTTTSLQRGDRLEFVARIYPVAETPGRKQFDYGRYLNLKGVFGVVYLPTLLDVRLDQRSRFGFFAAIDQLRNAIRDVLHANLSPQSAALASGFLIGETRDIPPAVYQLFRDSGTLHLMAVSGSNVAVVLFFFYLLLQPLHLTSFRRTLTLLAVITIFAALSYGEPSVLRASIMASLIVGARLMQRRYDLNNIIALAMLIILLLQPAQLYDVGFQLSFATAWGLIFFVPPITGLFARHHSRPWYRWLAFPIIISGVAQICSAPIIGYYFERVPVISVAANLIIVPLASLALVGILILLVSHLVLPLLGAVVGGLLDVLLAGALQAVAFFGSSSLPSMSFKPVWPVWVVVTIIMLFYLLLLIATLALDSKRARRMAIALVLVCVNAGLILSAASRVDAFHPHMHVSTVPGGVMAVCQGCADNHGDLIITNLSAKPYDIAEKILLPSLKQHGVEHLDRIFVLSAAYQSLDDLLGFVDLTNTTVVYVSAAHESATREIIRELCWPDPLFTRVHFFGGNVQPASQGYHLNRDGIRLIWPDGSEVLFLNNVSSADTHPLTGGNATLVIGKSWRATADDWITLHQSGFHRIICPKIAHPPDLAEADPELRSSHFPPDYLSELMNAGEVEIEAGSSQ